MSVLLKLRFRDGLECSVNLTVEIKLRLQIPPLQCGLCLSLLYFTFP